MTRGKEEGEDQCTSVRGRSRGDEFSLFGISRLPCLFLTARDFEIKSTIFPRAAVLSASCLLSKLEIGNRKNIFCRIGRRWRWLFVCQQFSRCLLVLASRIIAAAAKKDKLPSR